jgi:hypothetical protein
MIRVPEFQEPGLTKFLSQMASDREDKLDQKLSKQTANHSLLLQSSGGKVYEIKVDDAGIITATLVAG